MTAITRTPGFLPKLIFSTQRLEVSTRPGCAIRLDWIGATGTEELDASEVARLIGKLTKWQTENVRTGQDHG